MTRIPPSISWRILLIVLVLWFMAAPLRPFTTIKIQGEEVFEYYGYIPTSFNYTSGLDVIPQPTPEDPNPGWRVNGTAYLDIIGYNDSTTVTVYDIARPEEPRAIAAHTINRMGNMTVRAPKGLYFKVVSNKPIATSIAGGNSYSGGSGSLFYPSTDGGFAGTEFIFMAHPTSLGGEAHMPGHTIHAIEDAQVTIYDSEGKSVWNKELKANSTYSSTELLIPRRVYRVISTGRIMVANWVAWSFTILPNIMGGYRGTRFYTKESDGGGSMNQQAVLLLLGQDQETDVKVVDPLGDKYSQKTLQPKEMWVVEGKSVPFTNKNTMVLSSNPIIAFSGDMNLTEGDVYTTMWDGVAIFAIRPNEPTTFPAISEGVIFSPEADETVRMGTLLLNISRGGYARLPAGLLTLTTRTTMIVQVRTARTSYYVAPGQWGSQAIIGTAENWVTYLITSKTANVTYPPPKAKDEGSGLLIAAAGAFVGASVAALVIWKKPWKR